jgi:hypothetical protein
MVHLETSIEKGPTIPSIGKAVVSQYGKKDGRKCMTDNRWCIHYRDAR